MAYHPVLTVAVHFVTFEKVYMYHNQGQHSPIFADLKVCFIMFSLLCCRVNYHSLFISDNVIGAVLFCIKYFLGPTLFVLCRWHLNRFRRHLQILSNLHWQLLMHGRYLSARQSPCDCFFPHAVLLSFLLFVVLGLPGVVWKLITITTSHNTTAEAQPRMLPDM